MDLYFFQIVTIKQKNNAFKCQTAVPQCAYIKSVLRI